jgi:uncharacterized protein DUF6600
MYTEEGWYFESDWEWGWAPFHYGRWYYDDAYGWLWVPGEEWGPAWVDWRESDEYIGWAPLPPPGIVVGVPRWTFVRSHVFLRRHLAEVAEPRDRIQSVYLYAPPVREVIVRGHAGWSPGPRVTHVERATGGRVPTVRAPRRPANVQIRRH